MLKELKLVALLAGVALAALAVACGGDDDDAQPTTSGSASAAFQQVPALDQPAPSGSKVFVGHDKDDKVSAGLIVFADSTAVAYECDGNETWTWYSGTASGNDLSLTSADGKTFTAKINGDAATGKTAGGDFTLETASGRSGVFRATFTKGSDTETQGWVLENDGKVRGGIAATIASKTTRLGASFTPSQTADIEALPEFAEIKQAIPGFPLIPTDLAVFSSSGGGLCKRIAFSLAARQIPETTLVENNLGNRVRMGLLGRLGCPQESLFVIE
jgi:hypothetical protein